LDTEVTEELKQEGTVRDLVRSIQNLRKDSGLDVTDRIYLYLMGTEDVKAAVESFEQHLLGETLAVTYTWKEPVDGVDVECGEGSCRIGLVKAEA
jgi:isoleucyl-tRNA synthetase